MVKKIWKRNSEERKRLILYPLEMVFIVKKIIKMYLKISEGKKPNWICLCDYSNWWRRIFIKTKIEGKTFRPCNICPANNLDNTFENCQGPGGEWEAINEYVEGQTIKEINDFKYNSDKIWIKRKLLSQAKKKAKAWEKWLEEQKQLWGFMGVKI